MKALTAKPGIVRSILRALRVKESTDSHQQFFNSHPCLGIHTHAQKQVHVHTYTYTHACNFFKRHIQFNSSVVIKENQPKLKYQVQNFALYVFLHPEAGGGGRVQWRESQTHYKLRSQIPKSHNLTCTYPHVNVDGIAYVDPCSSPRFPVMQDHSKALAIRTACGSHLRVPGSGLHLFAVLHTVPRTCLPQCSWSMGLHFILTYSLIRMWKPPQECSEEHSPPTHPLLFPSSCQHHSSGPHYQTSRLFLRTVIGR